MIRFSYVTWMTWWVQWFGVISSVAGTAQAWLVQLPPPAKKKKLTPRITLATTKEKKQISTHSRNDTLRPVSQRNSMHFTSCAARWPASYRVCTVQCVRYLQGMRSFVHCAPPSAWTNSTVTLPKRCSGMFGGAPLLLNHMCQREKTTRASRIKNITMDALFCDLQGRKINFTNSKTLVGWLVSRFHKKTQKIKQRRSLQRSTPEAAQKMISC